MVAIVVGIFAVLFLGIVAFFVFALGGMDN